jgi:hypothetical protein
MTDWKTRLEVQLNGVRITPITSIQVTLNLPHVVMHSLEADNVGVVHQPRTFSFVMSIPAIGTAVADLTELALKQKEFEVIVQEAVNDEWTFKALKFIRCLVQSAQPSNVTVDGVPQATFTCISLMTSVEV